MTGLTMPACAVQLGNGHAYPMSPNRRREKTPAMAQALALAQVPMLPVGFHWADGPEVHGPRLLLDAPALGLLLYAAGLDPWAVGDHAVIAACHDQLSMSHGTTTRAQAVYARDVIADPEVAEARLRACTSRADHLIKAAA